jgi:methylmalonyl-CoA mutase C-terminal domain/subunit
MKALNEIGVGKLFPPGTTTTVIADFIKNWVKENRNF